MAGKKHKRTEMFHISTGIWVTRVYTFITMIKLLTVRKFYHNFFKRTKVLDLLTQTSHGIQNPRNRTILLSTFTKLSLLICSFAS